MATKKKHSNKKHSFKHVAPTSTQALPAATVAGKGTAPDVTTKPKRPVTQAAVAADVRDFSYVQTDMRRVILYGGLLILLELILWGVIDFTPFGQGIYNLVRL